MLDIHRVVLSVILRTGSTEKSHSWQDIPVEIAPIVYFSCTAVYVNTCLAIATGEEPWQRRPSVDKATPFSSRSIVSFE